MKPVTRDIDPHLAQDLLERVPRACLSFAADRGPQVQPVSVLWQNGRCLVGIPADADNLPEPGQEAVLLVDEGIFYFDLRAIYIRGAVQAQLMEPDRGSGQVNAIDDHLNLQADFTWLELVPIKTVAWDYGSMREVAPGDNPG